LFFLNNYSENLHFPAPVTPPVAAKLNKNGTYRKPYDMTGKCQARSAGEKEKKKKKSLIDRDKISCRFKAGCCGKECIWQHFSIDFMLAIRMRYASKDKKYRTALLRRFAEGAL